VLPARDRSLRIRSAAALGLACLPCFALPSLPCPACLPAFRHSVNLLLLSCCLLAGTMHCNTPASIEYSIGPFRPKFRGHSRRALSHSQIRARTQEPSPPSPPSHAKPPQSPSQSGLPSSIDTAKLCPFEAAALAFLCLRCIISLPRSEAHVGPC
jgi:hypothetical protein